MKCYWVFEVTRIRDRERGECEREKEIGMKTVCIIALLNVIMDEHAT